MDSDFWNFRGRINYVIKKLDISDSENGIYMCVRMCGCVFQGLMYLPLKPDVGNTYVKVSTLGLVTFTCSEFPEIPG